MKMEADVIQHYNEIKRDLDDDIRLARCLMTALSVGQREGDCICFTKEEAFNSTPNDWIVPHSELAMDTRQAGNKILLACLDRKNKGRTGVILTKQDVHADITGEKIKMCGFLDGLDTEIMPPSLVNKLKDQLNWK